MPLWAEPAINWVYPKGISFFLGGVSLSLSRPAARPEVTDAQSSMPKSFFWVPHTGLRSDNCLFLLLLPIWSIIRFIWGSKDSYITIGARNTMEEGQFSGLSSCL